MNAISLTGILPVTMLLAELGAYDNFRDNATMSRSKNIVACCAVANFSTIVALSLSRRNIVAHL